MDVQGYLEFHDPVAHRKPNFSTSVFFVYSTMCRLPLHLRCYGFFPQLPAAASQDAVRLAGPMARGVVSIVDLILSSSSLSDGFQRSAAAHLVEARILVQRGSTSDHCLGSGSDFSTI